MGHSSLGTVTQGLCIFRLEVLERGHFSVGAIHGLPVAQGRPGLYSDTRNYELPGTCHLARGLSGRPEDPENPPAPGGPQHGPHGGGVWRQLNGQKDRAGETGSPGAEGRGCPCCG